MSAGYVPGQKVRVVASTAHDSTTPCVGRVSTVMLVDPYTHPGRTYRVVGVPAWLFEDELEVAA